MILFIPGFRKRRPWAVYRRFINIIMADYGETAALNAFRSIMITVLLMGPLLISRSNDSTLKANARRAVNALT